MSSSSASDNQIAQLRSTSPHVLFFIARSKNKNIVVYEAILESDSSGLKKDKPIEVYWLDLDPAYQEKKRKKGITSDREELGSIEKQFAYGVSWTVDGNKYHLKLVALPDRAVSLVWDAATKSAHCLIPINGKSAWLERVYVDSTDSFIGLPKVNFVIIEGVDPESKAKVSEKIIPK